MEPSFYKKVALSNLVHLVLMTVTKWLFVTFKVNRAVFAQPIQNVAPLFTNIFLLCHTGYSAETNETADESGYNCFLMSEQLSLIAKFQSLAFQNS